MNKINFLYLVIFSCFVSISGSAQNLYIGTNYHPHDDKNPEKIKKEH